MKSGIVFDIQRFSIHDGPGIRTTVFLKGCHLRCVWCHNPESWSFKPQLAYSPSICIGCGGCVAACPNNAHLMTEEGRTLDRSLCNNCGACIEACPSGALETAGKSMTVDEVVDEVKRDMPFYAGSNGGMTLSGGEPLAQPEFAAGILAAAQQEGIHTAIETAGYGKPEAVEAIVSRCDLVLFDLKAAPADHERLTGQPFDIIKTSLERICSMGISVHLRLPLVPDVNDNPAHFASVRELQAVYPNIGKTDIIPYHNLAAAKYERFGCAPPQLESDRPTEEQLARWKAELGL